MSVWVCMPSARPQESANEILKLWRERGYRTAVQRDKGALPVDADMLIWTEKYEGWGAAINMLSRMVFEHDPACDWIVAGADDIEPDPTHEPEAIAEECTMHFDSGAHVWGGCQSKPDDVYGSAEWVRYCKACGMEDTCEDPLPGCPTSFGVMQPIGDRFAGGSIDRICGSPWIGREFCRRMYGGRGPFNPEYRHMFVDEELQEVAIKLGVLWQRPDLVHLHLHFMREHRGLASNATRTEVPAHLVEANTREHWDKYKAIFEARKAAGFPGHEPIA